MISVVFVSLSGSRLVLILSTEVFSCFDLSLVLSVFLRSSRFIECHFKNIIRLPLSVFLGQANTLFHY